MLSDLYNFRMISDKLGTSGQPKEGEFRYIHEAGFEIVINLATPDSKYAISNEGSIITGFGMTYMHIPVDFKNPASGDFDSFCRILNTYHDKKIFVHCIANMRVSVFIFLYRVLLNHMPAAEAEPDLLAIWKPDEVWKRFILSQFEFGKQPPG